MNNTDKTFSITTGVDKANIYNTDVEAHTSDCGDVKKLGSIQVFPGADAEAAVIAVDTDAASWFCEEPYTESARENGVWSLAAFEIKPCLRKSLKAAGVTPHFAIAPTVK